MRSRLSRLKKLSATALSWQFPPSAHGVFQIVSLGEGRRSMGAVDAFNKLHAPPRYIARNWFVRMFWPETYARRRLRLGRNIIFHELSEVESEQYPHRMVFDRSASATFDPGRYSVII